MKRETLMKLVLLLLSIVLLLFFWSGMDFNGRSAALTELHVSEEEYRELIDDREPRDTSLQLKVTFNETELTYDAATKTYYYPVIGDTPTAFNPVVKAQAGNAQGYRVRVTGAGISKQTIRENEKLRVVVYGDGWYEEFSVVTTPLPILKIELDDPMTNPDIGDANKDALITLYDTHPVTPSSQVQISKAQVRWRGASSRIFPQKQIRLSLQVISLGRNMRNNHLPLLGMREDDDWILYAPYNDPEKMRNLLSNRLWYESMAGNNRFGVQNGTHGKYTEVFVNGEYRGIYVLMHPMDAKQLELDEREDSGHPDYYYRMMSNVGLDPAKYDGSIPHNLISPVELRFPEETDDHKAKWQPLLRHYQMMHQRDEEAESYLYEQTDVENQIDYWLFYMLTSAYDNDTKNRNYIAKHDGQQYIMLESPWDLDLTWGNVYSDQDDLRSTFDHNVDRITPLYPSLITNEIDKGNQDIIDHVIRRYEELRATTWSDDHIEQMLAAFETDVYGSGAAVRHHERWPLAAHSTDAQAFRERVLRRLEVVDAYIQKQLKGGR